MLLVGAIFLNVLALTVSGLLLLFLFIEGMTFHRSVGLAEECLTVKSEPQTITCTVGRTIEAQNTISNPSNLNFRISGVFVPRQFQSPHQKLSSEEFLLKKNEAQILRSRFECGIPGRFHIQALKVNLTSRMNLFTQTVWARCKLSVIARPIVNSSRLASIDSSFLDDLTSDKIRRGAGTDLAGIRPSALAEDLHRVDWKATARTGNLMVKEFFLERQPPVMLLIDASRTMKAVRDGKSMFSQLVAALPNLLASFRPATPMGLTLYNENSIVTKIATQVGEYQRELILQALLHFPEIENASKPIQRKSEGRRIRGTVATTPTMRQQYLRTLSPSLARFYWLFRDGRLRQEERLRKQGAFLALTQIGGDSECFLIIAVTDGKTNLNGLIEGARAATVSGHRVVLVLLTDYRKIPTSYVFPELQNIGVRMQECQPERLPAVIRAEIGRMSQQRILA